MTFIFELGLPKKAWAIRPAALWTSLDESIVKELGRLFWADSFNSSGTRTALAPLFTASSRKLNPWTLVPGRAIKRQPGAAFLESIAREEISTEASP